jgi:hypothetical protein
VNRSNRPSPRYTTRGVVGNIAVCTSRAGERNGSSYRGQNSSAYCGVVHGQTSNPGFPTAGKSFGNSAFHPFRPTHPAIHPCPSIHPYSTRPSLRTGSRREWRPAEDRQRRQRLDGHLAQEWEREGTRAVTHPGHPAVWAYEWERQSRGCAEEGSRSDRARTGQRQRPNRPLLLHE